MRRLPLILLIAAILHTSQACSEEKHEYVANAGERTPTMCTTDVNTFVSDSGYTRYKIETPTMGDVRKTPKTLTGTSPTGCTCCSSTKK